MIAAFDLDGTLLKKNSSFAFCRFLCENGFLSYRDLIFCTYMYVRHCYFGLPLLDLHQSIFQKFFFGTKIDVLRPFVQKFLEEKLQPLWYPPALSRLRIHQQRGEECIILSNSPDFLVVPIAQKIGINKVFATIYQSNDKGELIKIASLMDGNRKADVITHFFPKITAFSDSHIDLAFLQKAAIAVAVNPKRKLKRIAKQKGWEIL